MFYFIVVQSMFYGGATGGVFSLLQYLGMTSFGTGIMIALGAIFGSLFDDQDVFAKMSVEWYGCLMKGLIMTIKCVVVDGKKPEYCREKYESGWTAMKAYQIDLSGEFHCKF